MPLGVQYSGMWTLAQQFQAIGAGTWKNINKDYLWTWGKNDIGQLGDNTLTDKSSPIQVGTTHSWSQIDAGTKHSMAIKTDGTMWLWGRTNAYGTLGDDTTINRSSPVQVGALTTWSKIAAGGKHSMAIKTDGTMWSWGYNAEGQLGNGLTTYRSSPIQIGALTTWSLISINFHSLAIKTDGTMWSWGNNTNGRLGLNIISLTNSPVQVGALTTWSKVAAGGNHSMALKTDGTMWLWGGNQYGAGTDGQLGDNTVIRRSSPVQIGALTTWTQIDAGGSFSMAIKTDGTMWSWGLNSSGQLGNNTIIARSSPVQIGALTTWSKIAAGGDNNHALALKTDGTMWSWGGGGEGQLGINASTGSRSSPIQVGALTTWSLISAGGYHNMAITHEVS